MAEELCVYSLLLTTFPTVGKRTSVVLILNPKGFGHHLTGGGGRVYIPLPLVPYTPFTNLGNGRNKAALITNRRMGEDSGVWFCAAMGAHQDWPFLSLKCVLPCLSWPG